MVERERLRVEVVLSTSHVPDATAGNAALAKALPASTAFLGFDKRIPGLNRPLLEHNQRVPCT